MLIKTHKEFLATTAKFNEKGEAYIEINGDPKLVKSLTAADKSVFKASDK